MYSAVHWKWVAPRHRMHLDLPEVGQPPGLPKVPSTTAKHYGAHPESDL